MPVRGAWAVVRHVRAAATRRVPITRAVRTDRPLAANMRGGRSMATERQRSANRRNAQRSTGPKTVEGKLAVGHNALKHGLLSQHALLPEEDASALADLSRRVFDALEPTGEFESLLVDRIVQGVWRLRRLGLVETGLFASAKY